MWGLRNAVNQFALKPYAQQLSIRYVSGRRNQKNLSCQRLPQTPQLDFPARRVASALGHNVTFSAISTAAAWRLLSGSRRFGTRPEYASSVRLGTGSLASSKPLRVQGATLGPVKVNAARLRFLMIRGLMRLDVLVEPQHILGVVLFLDLHQASVVRSVRRPDKLFAGFAQLVDVHSIRKGLQIV